jgi:glutamate formiminotransferase
MRSFEVLQKMIDKLRNESILITINAIEYERLKLKGLNPELHLDKEREIVEYIEREIEGLTNEEKEEVLFSFYLNLINLMINRFLIQNTTSEAG